MKIHMRHKLLLIAALVFACIASAQEERDAEGERQPAPQAATDDKDPLAAPPFTARIEVDNRQPVSYGEDVNVSVWITPHKSLEIEHIRLHPKGNLLALYRSAEQIHKDLRDDNSASVEQGTACRTRELNHRPGVPFVATCGMDSLQNGWRQWFDQNSLLDSGRQRFEIEVALQDAPGAMTAYYEVGSIDFVSPKAAVVLGGFFGALILSLLTFAAKPVGNAPVLNSWKEVATRFWNASPQGVTSFSFGIIDVMRKALLGGVTAMVLIILAKSSEGFEAPLSLHIQDFWGGLLVGLVSVHLANWVLNKINNLIQPMR